MKLVARGETRQDILDILAANSRLPNSNWGDLNGQLNALDLGETPAQRACSTSTGEDDRRTPPSMAFSVRAEALMREAVAALPDGTYAFEDYLDNDGIVDERLTVALDLTIAGDDDDARFLPHRAALRRPAQHLDAQPRSLACYVALKHLSSPHVPANAGLHSAPITLRCAGDNACSVSKAAAARWVATPRPSCG